METMKLQDVVELVRNVLKEKGSTFHTNSYGGDTVFYTLTQQEKQDNFTKSPPIEWSEIENINQTIWALDYSSGESLVIYSAIGVNLASQCRGLTAREEMTEKIQNLRKYVSEQWTRRYLKRLKLFGKDKIDESTLYGTFNKFEFIQKFGFMYDSEEEANTDANDTTATCPLIMSQLNSGWINFRATEKDGRIIVEKRTDNPLVDPVSMLYHVEEEFKTWKVWNVMVDRFRSILAVEYFSDFMRPVYNIIPSPWGENIKSRDSFIYMLVVNMLDNPSAYPQEVYDFQKVNSELIAFVDQVLGFADSLDETMTEQTIAVVQECMEYMRKMSEMECQIISEQHLRDEKTGRFIKPKIKLGYLVYTRIISSVISQLEFKFDKAMRIKSIYRICPKPRYAWAKEALYKAKQNGTLDKLVNEMKEDYEKRKKNNWFLASKSIRIGSEEIKYDSEETHPYFMYEQWIEEYERYVQDEKRMNPFYDINSKRREYFEAQYHLSEKLNVGY